MPETKSRLMAPPTAVRLLNSALGLAGSTFEEIATENPLVLAERITRLDDWGTDAARARFEHLVELIGRNPRITPWGKLGARIVFAWKMTNHLRRVDYVKKHPEVRDIEIRSPLVILGWYRTGTTLLHNLLGSDPSHRLPRTYEISFPVPFSKDAERDAALRRAMTSFVLGTNRFLIPEQAAAHFIETDGPEECFFLWENAGISTTHINTFLAHDYAYELLQMNAEELYADHKLQLQILSQQGQGDRTWVLKCPFHLWNIDALVEAYPDARIVWTHREARKSLASNCSLSAMTTSKFTDGLDLHEHGRFWFDFYRVGLDRALASRERIPASQFADVRTSELARSPVETVKGIYDRFGMRWTPELESAYRETAARHPKDAHGKHRYDLSTFGLSEAEVDARFENYEQSFGLRKKNTEGSPRITP